MKISIGSKIVDGPWGGGNLFIKNMTEYLVSQGHEVINSLSESNIDLILLTDPRNKRESSSTFNHIDIAKYKKYVNKNVKVVQRINECDERKGTNGVNELYLTASKVADKVIFVSSWLENIYLDLGMSKEKTIVILAGANRNIFNDKDSSEWIENTKLKLVTHHWSSNENKGFKYYQEINKLIKSEKWKDKIEFTYIGNINPDYDLSNTRILKPLSGKELATEIKKNHIYITGTINEPSGNHHIEAAQCGLPILYLESGGVPEYCQEYGVGFKNNIEKSLELLINNYQEYRNKLKNYPHNSDKMCNDFLFCFEELVNENSTLKNEKTTLKGLAYLVMIKLTVIFRENIYQSSKKIIKKIIKKIT